MSADTLRTFARVRSLALAAMIDAGGKPCWVAAAPAAATAVVASAGLTPVELSLLSACKPALLATITRALAALERGPVATSSRMSAKPVRVASRKRAQTVA